MLAQCAAVYRGVFQRYLLADPGSAGALPREQALFEATQVGMAALAQAPTLDQLVALHGQAQAALADAWRAGAVGGAERDAHDRMAAGAATALAFALTLPHSLSERAHKEQRWRETHAKLAALFEQTDALILGLDAGGFVETVNPAFRRATGWSALEVTTFGAAGWQGPLPTQATLYARLEQPRRDGSRFLVEWSVSPILGRDGRLRSHICIGHDITRQQQIEEGLRDNDKLRAVATLAGGIAHDFNNLLGSIIGLAELCEMQAAAGSVQARNLGRIGQVGSKAAALVRQLLDFSRQTPQSLEPMPASTLLAHAEGLLRAALPLDIGLVVAIAEDGWLDVDLVQMEQVLMNITGNAAHAMKDSGGEVRITADRADPANASPGTEAGARPDGDVARHLRLRISDGGTGIAAAALPKIFAPFYTTKPVGEGTGLGLAAVHGIVSKHGGVIEVASELGVGTTFSVFLPLAHPGGTSTLETTNLSLTRT
jgi:signal transduction histidine kinase